MTPPEGPPDDLEDNEDDAEAWNELADEFEPLTSDSDENGPPEPEASGAGQHVDAPDAWSGELESPPALSGEPPDDAISSSGDEASEPNLGSQPLPGPPVPARRDLFDPEESSIPDVGAAFTTDTGDADHTGTAHRQQSPRDDRSRGAASVDRPATRDLVGRRGQPKRIEVLPYNPRHDAGTPGIQLDSEIVDAPGTGERHASTPTSPAPSPGLLLPTSDGGPPLARPIVLVRLSEDQLRHAREEALLDASRRDARTCEEIAQQKCDQLLYFLHTEERRLNPGLR